MKTTTYVVEKVVAGKVESYVSNYDSFQNHYTLGSIPMEFMVAADAVAIAEHKNRSIALNGLKNVIYVVKKRFTDETEIPLPALEAYLADRPRIEIEDEEAPEGSGVREPQPEDEVKLENPEADVEIED